MEDAEKAEALEALKALNALRAMSQNSRIMAGTSIVVVVQMLPLEKLDIPPTVALFIFAFGIPFFILLGLRPHYSREGACDYFFFQLVFVIACVCIFFHFGIATGVAFCISASAGMIIFLRLAFLMPPYTEPRAMLALLKVVGLCPVRLLGLAFSKWKPIDTPPPPTQQSKPEDK